MNTPSSTALMNEVTARIDTATRKAGRDKGSVRLIAVSKTFPADNILPLIEAGHRHFGENRIQEAVSKWPPIKEKYPDIVLHMIGPLQSNKAGEAIAHFDVIHSLDRPRLAEKLAAEMSKQGRRPEVLVQINTGKEPQKAGIDPEASDDFISECRNSWKLPVSGLMCIPPGNEEPSPHFALLREIARRNNLDELSMGMSADFETAIMFGATYVRVGSAIFGPRDKMA